MRVMEISTYKILDDRYYKPKNLKDLPVFMHCTGGYTDIRKTMLDESMPIFQLHGFIIEIK